MYEGKQKLQKIFMFRLYKDKNTITQISLTSALGYGAMEQKTLYVTKKNPKFKLLFSIFNTLDNVFQFLGKD